MKAVRGRPAVRAAWALLGAAAWACGAGPAQAASLSIRVVDREGQPVPGAAVVVHSPLSTGPAPALAPVEIVQRDMKFVPAVAVVTPGTTVRFTNQDTWDHHVRGTGGGSFEFRIAGAEPAGKPGGRGAPKVPAQVVLQGGTGPVQLGCFLHSRMAGNLYVSDSPHYGVTDAAGQVQIEAVPDGSVRIHAWHPQQILEQPAQAAQARPGGEPLVVTLNFTPRRKR